MIKQRHKNEKQFKGDITSIITILVSVIALIFSGISLYITIQPDNTKLTIKSSRAEQCFNLGIGCNKLFIYNNDKAPCFEFKLVYDKDVFNEIVLLKDYDKSNIFNANFDGKTIFFPAMPTIPISGSWLGYLDKKQIAYFAFFQNTKSKKEKKVTVSCVDYEETIVFE